MAQIVYIRKILPASPEKVSDAWIVSHLMSKWLFKSPDNVIEVRLQELREGRQYSIMETTIENEKIDHFGKYLTITPGRELSFTLEVPWHFPGVAPSLSRITGRLCSRN